MNKSSIILILMVILVVGVGCAKPDWIQQTLVTVDVTGTWQGSTTDGWFEFVLQQQGAKVTGSVLVRGLRGSGNNISGPIDGAMAGDVFSFRQTNGNLTGETTVTGDEMSGQVRVLSRNQILLRRVDSSAPPRSQ